jgi:nucleotide-binding universal stress UspA family protein
MFMEKYERPVVVPWDFSQVAENAFQHAVNISRMLNREILLLHIVHEERAMDSKRAELNASADKLAKAYGKKPYCEVVNGSIFHAIGEKAKALKAEMIVMGTHGIVGAQKLFGSKALKVVVSSRIPFLVIQDKPSKSTIDTILLPIDFKSENKEKANWIYYLARNFGSRFIILKSRARDKGFRRKILSNIKYVETFLKGHDIAYEIVTTPGKESFKKEIIAFATDHNADMILIMATRDIRWTDYLFGAPEQYILANPANLPVLCMNPRHAKISSGFRAAGGSG